MAKFSSTSWLPCHSHSSSPFGSSVCLFHFSNKAIYIDTINRSLEKVPVFSSSLQVFLGYKSYNLLTLLFILRGTERNSLWCMLHSSLYTMPYNDLTRHAQCIRWMNESLDRTSLPVTFLHMAHQVTFCRQCLPANVHVW